MDAAGLAQVDGAMADLIAAANWRARRCWWRATARWCTGRCWG